MASAEVIVVGGGIAGISAALLLTEYGKRVILLERTNALGGRAGSFDHPETGAIDVGHHVYLGCCKAFRRLLHDLGTAHLAPLSKRLDVALIDVEGGPRASRLRAAPLPYPLSLLGALLRYGHMSLPKRLGAIRTIASAVRSFRRGVSEPTFADWLEKVGTPASATRVLWRPLILAALNAEPHEVSAEDGIMVIAKGLAGGAKAAAVGLFCAPLRELFRPVPDRLAPLGRVHLGRSVQSILIEGGRAVGVRLSDGSALRSHHTVVATSHVHLGKLLPFDLRRDPYFARIAQIETRPIVNVHLWYDRPIVQRPMTGFIGSPLQWLFDLSSLYTDAGSPRHYALSQSGAHWEMEMPAEHLIRTMDSELKRALPHAANVRLLRGAVRKMRHATFSPAPDVRAKRPANHTPVPGLFLAGDYTSTGWPSTMEGAVISGRNAARAIVSSSDR